MQFQWAVWVYLLHGQFTNLRLFYETCVIGLSWISYIHDVAGRCVKGSSSMKCPINTTLNIAMQSVWRFDNQCVTYQTNKIACRFGVITKSSCSKNYKNNTKVLIYELGTCKNTALLMHVYIAYHAHVLIKQIKRGGSKSGNLYSYTLLIWNTQ